MRSIAEAQCRCGHRLGYHEPECRGDGEIGRCTACSCEAFVESEVERGERVATVERQEALRRRLIGRWDTDA